MNKLLSIDLYFCFLHDTSTTAIYTNTVTLSLPDALPILFGTITEGLLKGLEDLEVGGRVETIQITALLRTARILNRVLET